MTVLGPGQSSRYSAEVKENVELYPYSPPERSCSVIK
jgi:hypothetical protein